jgi:hypothetical protein
MQWMFDLKCLDRVTSAIFSCTFYVKHWAFTRHIHPRCSIRPALNFPSVQQTCALNIMQATARPYMVQVVKAAGHRLRDRSSTLGKTSYCFLPNTSTQVSVSAMGTGNQSSELTRNHWARTYDEIINRVVPFLYSIALIHHPLSQYQTWCFRLRFTEVILGTMKRIPKDFSA